MAQPLTEVITTFPSGAWQSLDLLRLLAELYARGHVAEVLDILKAPKALCLDLLVIGLASALG